MRKHLKDVTPEGAQTPVDIIHALTEDNSPKAIGESFHDNTAEYMMSVKGSTLAASAKLTALIQISSFDYMKAL